jgi:hypothetical protein
VNESRRKELRPALGVLHGFTYGDHSQVFSHCLVPGYQSFFRWTGTRPDAEDATRFLFETVVARLALPAPVEEVHGRVGRASIDVLGRHWSVGYGVSAARWSAIAGRRGIATWETRIGLEALVDPLPGELRLVLVLRFLRQRGMAAIAARLHVHTVAANLLLCEALAAVGARIGLPELGLTAIQAGQVARFVDDLVAKRRPMRFEAGPGAVTALLAATHIQAAIAGNDLPGPRFVRRLEAAFPWSGPRCNGPP